MINTCLVASYLKITCPIILQPLYAYIYTAIINGLTVYYAIYVCTLQ